MGDRRASIKIEFSMHGETKKADMWINWSPDDYDGVDQRILDFFSEAVRQMESKFWEAQERAASKQRKKAEEEAERKEYERLKAKFEEQQHG